jgi:hypothetical protein
MDPYLERHWGDVHASLVIYARDQLNRTLPRDLRARVEERLLVESPEGQRPIIPDVRILKRAVPGMRPGGRASGVAIAEPLILPLDEPITESYIEIRDVSTDRRVITVIEVLSPSNKTPGDARNEFLRKQQELLKGQVSLVEIDLLRSGKLIWPFPMQNLPAEHQTPYGVCITRASQVKQVEFYPISLRKPLPTIGVPLRQSDADAPVNLQRLIEQCYENGSYTDDLDYRAEPDPPLSANDAQWADALLRKEGKRGSAGRRGRRNGKR